jgi:hypothetical protein
MEYWSTGVLEYCGREAPLRRFLAQPQSFPAFAALPALTVFQSRPSSRARSDAARMADIRV